MQKIIYIDDKYTSEVNEELSKGWKVISVSPVSNHTGAGYTYHFGAYVVLEKNENNNKNNNKTDNKIDNNFNMKERLAEMSRELAYKHFYDPEVIV